jgi:hypothetical protein
MGEACSKHGLAKIFFRKPEQKRLLGRPRGRWEDNIKIDIKYMV